MPFDLFINGQACLTGDAPVEDFAPFLDVRKLRRAQAVSKNALLCACKALAQAQLAPQAQTDMGISLALGAGALESTLKFIDTIVEDGDELSSPTAFASSVHNSTALMLSMFLHIHGPCIVTGQFDSSFAAALLSAQQFLQKNMCEQVLVVISEDINPLVEQCVQQDAHVFDPFIYQPQSAFQRVAGAFVISAKPTEKTSHILRQVSLSRTDDISTQSQPQFPVSSCAHSVLLFEERLKTNSPFVWREQFAGSILEITGEPYVFS